MNAFDQWTEKKLGTVLFVQGGYAFKSSLFNQGNTKVIRIGDIIPIIKTKEFTGIYSVEIPDDRYMVKKNDFVIALSGATLGKVGKITNDDIAYINQRVATFRTEQNLEYFFQLTQTKTFKNYIKSIPAASAQPNISTNDIENYTSFIPHLEEQKK